MTYTVTSDIDGKSLIEIPYDYPAGIQFGVVIYQELYTPNGATLLYPNSDADSLVNRAKFSRIPNGTYLFKAFQEIFGSSFPRSLITEVPNIVVDVAAVPVTITPIYTFNPSSLIATNGSIKVRVNGRGNDFSFRYRIDGGSWIVSDTDNRELLFAGLGVGTHTIDVEFGHLLPVIFQESEQYVFDLVFQECNLIVSYIQTSNISFPRSADGKIIEVGLENYTSAEYRVMNSDKSLVVYGWSSLADLKTYDFGVNDYVLEVRDLSGGCLAELGFTIGEAEPKYYINTKNRLKQNLSIKIYQRGFRDVGKPLCISVDGCILNYDGDTNDKFDEVKGSSCTLTIISDYEFEFLPFLSAQDKEYMLEIKKGAEIVWCGWLQPEFYDQPIRKGIYPVTFTFFDGLGLLKYVDYPFEVQIPNEFGSIFDLYEAFGNSEYVLSVIQKCLKQIELNLDLDIDFENYPGTLFDINNLESDPFAEFPPEVLFSFNQMLINVENLGKTGDSCYTILKNLLTGFGLRMWQSRGKWRISEIRNLHKQKSVRTYQPNALSPHQITAKTDFFDYSCQTLPYFFAGAKYRVFFPYNGIKFEPASKIVKQMIIEPLKKDYWKAESQRFGSTEIVEAQYRVSPKVTKDTIQLNPVNSQAGRIYSTIKANPSWFYGVTFNAIMHESVDVRFSARLTDVGSGTFRYAVVIGIIGSWRYLQADKISFDSVEHYFTQSITQDSTKLLTANVEIKGINIFNRISEVTFEETEFMSLVLEQAVYSSGVLETQFFDFDTPFKFIPILESLITGDEFVIKNDSVFKTPAKTKKVYFFEDGITLEKTMPFIVGFRRNASETKKPFVSFLINDFLNQHSKAVFLLQGTMKGDLSFGSVVTIPLVFSQRASYQDEQEYEDGNPQYFEEENIYAGIYKTYVLTGGSFDIIRSTVDGEWIEMLDE